MRVSEFLLEGAENGKTGSELQAILHIDSRNLRRMVEQERREGVPICADENGYYIAANTSEVTRFIRRTYSHAYAMLKTANAVKKRWRSHEEPMKGVASSGRD